MVLGAVAARAGHLAEELLVVVVMAGDDAAFAFEDLVELAAVEPDAAAGAAGVDAHATAFDRDEVAPAAGAWSVAGVPVNLP